MSESWMSSDSSNTPDDRFGGFGVVKTKEVVILSGEGELDALTLLGKVGSSTPTTGTADGGNTGNGTMTGVAGDSKTESGDVYTVMCTKKQAVGTAKIFDPNKNMIDNAEVGTGFTSEYINLTLNDGSIDFAKGDKFTCVATGATPTTGTAGDDNTGNGTCASVTAGTNCINGTYVAECIDAETNGGIFELINPLGEKLANITVGTPYTGEVNATISDGATDFVVGDFFTIACTVTTAATGTADGGNVGNGTMTGATAGDKCMAGTYTIEIIEETVTYETFKVADQDGNQLEDAVAATAYTSEFLNFLINQGVTDYVVGDLFTVTIAAGSGKYIQSLAAAVDGSEDPDCILGEDVDATSADVTTWAYERGVFNDDDITFGTGHTATNTREELRGKGIYLETNAVS